MSDIKDAESEAFRKWFLSQKTYASLSAMERALGITRDYLHVIRDGTRRAIDPELRRKLKEATGLKEFEPIIEDPKSSVEYAERAENVRQTSTSTVFQNEKKLPENLSALLEQALQKLGLTMKECSQKYKIPLGSLKKYKNGVRKPTAGANIDAVLEILNDAGLIASEKKTIEKLKSLDQAVNTSALIREIQGLKEKVNQIDARLSAARLYQKSTESASTNAEEKARKVMRLLISLSGELEFFKNCSEEERKTFKRIVPGQDVGYVTTLLRALYDEDKFQRWLLFSTYTLKGKENGE